MSANGIPPHVTLLYPWRTCVRDDAAQLQVSAERIKELELPLVRLTFEALDFGRIAGAGDVVIAHLRISTGDRPTTPSDWICAPTMARVCDSHASGFPM
jgi:hypothetical protein